MRRLSLLAVVLVGLSTLTGSVATAHSTLIAAIPEPSASVSELTVIELEFGSPLIDDGKATLALATIREGRDLPIGEVEFVSEFVIRALVDDPPPPGDYVVRYQVTSEDGDLNDGGYTFTLLGSRGSGVTWILLGIGIVALGAVGFLLRPRRKPTGRASSSGTRSSRTR